MRKLFLIELYLLISLFIFVSCNKKYRSKNGYEYVDLGLSVLWATCNVGAENPEDCGDHFSWGEVIPEKRNAQYKTDGYAGYKWVMNKWGYHGYENNSLIKYCTDREEGYYGFRDNKIVLESGDDAATVNWGYPWRMPTDAEQDELFYKCKWKKTKCKGVIGYKVIGPNGNSIFLPIDAAYGMAGYWSSSLDVEHPDNAHDISFHDSGNLFELSSLRYSAYFVRPVFP